MSDRTLKFLLLVGVLLALIGGFGYLTRSLILERVPATVPFQGIAVPVRLPVSVLVLVIIMVAAWPALLHVRGWLRNEDINESFVIRRDAKKKDGGPANPKSPR